MITPEIAPEVAITSVAVRGCGLCRSSVQARFCPTSYNRTGDCELDRIIDEMWNASKARSPHLINRTKFRLHDVEPNRTCVLLDLGLTCCKEYMGTNCLPMSQASIWQRKGEFKFQNKSAFMANPLSVGAIVHTNDDKYVFVRRTQDCCENAGYVDRPAGYPCPQKVSLDAGCGSEERNSCALVDALFDSIIRLIEAETSIPPDYLGEPELLGFAQDRSRCFKPSLEFYVNCNLDSERIYFLYSRRQQALGCNASSIVLATWSEMSSISSLFFRSLGVAAKGAILLYRELNYH